MAIIRTKADEAVQVPQFRVNLNITLNGSKSMSNAEQDKSIKYDNVRVYIYAGADETPVVLVDERAPAKAFSTGSVGYSVQIKDAEFVQS